jgi:hypothetical protein
MLGKHRAAHGTHARGDTTPVVAHDPRVYGGASGTARLLSSPTDEASRRRVGELPPPALQLLEPALDLAKLRGVGRVVELSQPGP